ncbi:glycosyltransferase family 1 protein [Oceanicola sp. 502str15]|uniref:glycosyltransferase family 4 protein n=1 Tax=Oceanicola sp. 502str15 TaxID=2696061 RepID=UPI00209642E2|nr:glycosyltransferase family 1 protein [Oceanicola sp. 502str15]MCO6384251.1 glycosyltransferase [Oceanicola sp. 502str15]
MSAEAPPRCLDLSRLVSRVGRGPLTGVDRVERAYLDRLLTDDAPLYALIRLPLSYALLDRRGLAALAARLAAGGKWGSADIQALLNRRLSPLQRRVHADIRSLARATCLRSRLPSMLARHLPRGARYLNVGHSNLTGRVFEAMKANLCEITVLVHDMIPLDHPEFQRDGQPEQFEAAMRRVSRHADRIIYNSEVSQQRGIEWFGRFGRIPEGLVALLGVDTPKPSAAEALPALPPDRPYFVTTGTIEPRKNHALLLDAWEKLANMPGPRPVLLIIGSRGWNNEALFARLDASPALGRDIFELHGLNDGAVAQLTRGACAALFPSHAEGFGLPPAEALAQRTPVIVNDLPVYREFLGDLPVYLKGNDIYLWAKTIHEMATMGQAVPRVELERLHLPTWEAHFNKVLSVT